MNKKILIITLLLFLTACTVNRETEITYQTISAEEAIKAMEDDDYIILIDVRTPEEREERYIPGSILIPFDQLEEIITLAVTDLRTRIFIYCRSGNRSRMASQLLINLGYRYVYNIEEGINGWPLES